MLIIKILPIDTDAYTEIICEKKDLSTLAYVLDKSSYVKAFKVSVAGEGIPNNNYFCASEKWVEKWEWES